MTVETKAEEKKPLTQAQISELLSRASKRKCGLIFPVGKMGSHYLQTVRRLKVTNENVTATFDSSGSVKVSIFHEPAGDYMTFTPGDRVHNNKFLAFLEELMEAEEQGADCRIQPDVSFNQGA
jgi:hypothetical protein